MWLHADKDLGFCFAQSRKVTFSLFLFWGDLPAFHLPPCCSSIFGGLVENGGGSFQTWRMWFREHAGWRCGSTSIWAIPCLLLQFYFNLFSSPFFTLLAAALLQWFSQKKEQLPDLFLAWLLHLDPQDRVPSLTGCRPHRHCGQQHLPHLPTTHCNQALLFSKGSISTEDIFLFVCLLSNIFISFSANNTATLSNGEGS